MRRKMLLLVGLLILVPTAVRAAAPVDLAIVLLTDVSNSMDDAEYAMVKAGYRAAFADPAVIAAVLGLHGGVAVAYVEFSDEHEFALVQGWDILDDAAAVTAFGEVVAAAPRTSAGNTALAASLRQAARLLEEGDFGSARLVIDVASDHPSDGGRSGPVRDAVVAAGITINALPIIDRRPIGTFDGRMSYSSGWGPNGVADFYLRSVIGGAGSFMIEANDSSVFGEALKRKLLLELIADEERGEAGKSAEGAAPQPIDRAEVERLTVNAVEGVTR